MITVTSIALFLAPTAWAAWPPSPEVGFAADVYPSAADAARGLAPRVEQRVRDVLDGRTPQRIHVAADSVDTLEAPVHDVLAEAMRRSFGDGVSVLTDRPSRPLEDGVVHVHPRVRRDANHAAPGTDQTFRGTLTVVIRVAGRAGECAAQFDEKPWLTDPEQFRRTRPGRWVVAQADAPSSTPDGAKRDAIASAVAELVPLLAAEAGGGTGAVDGEFAAQRLSAALSSGRLVADRFACRFERPYGDVFHEAILVDASPADLKAIAAEAAGARQAAVRSKLNTGGSIVGLVVTIGLIYAVTNFLTKGYFAGRLRALALLALIAGAAAVVALLA